MLKACDHTKHKMIIGQLLSPNSLKIGLEVSSRKRLFDYLGEILAQGTDKVCARQIAKALHQRERLGSTVVGNEVGLPHARVEGLSSPAVAAITLSSAIKEAGYESLRLVFGLIVPVNANEGALELLAQLAQLADNTTFVARLLKEKNPRRWCELIRHQQRR